MIIPTKTFLQTPYGNYEHWLNNVPLVGDKFLLTIRQTCENVFGYKKESVVVFNRRFKIVDREFVLSQHENSNSYIQDCLICTLELQEIAMHAQDFKLINGENTSYTDYIATMKG